MTLCNLGALRGEGSEDKLYSVLESSKQGMGLLIFSSTKWDILRQGYSAMESFADHIPAFLPVLCFTSPSQSDTCIRT